MEGSKVPPTSDQLMNKYRLRDKMSLLNSDFLSVIKHYHQEKPFYDFTATMRSYIDHVKELRVIYKIDENDEPVTKTEKKMAKSPIPSPKKSLEIIAEKIVTAAPPAGRKIAKAQRKNKDNVANSTVFAASSPAATLAPPKFGDISMITKATPAPLEKSKKVEEPSAAPARKRAIRGGGPLGGSESVVFKSGNLEIPDKPAVATSSVPMPTIKFPEPSKDFWTKKSEKKDDGPPNNGGSLFGFLKTGSTETTSPPKFTGFSFGNKTENKEKDETEEKKKDDKPALSFPKVTFGESPAKKVETSVTVGGLFGKSPEVAKTGETSKPATLSFPSFGGASSSEKDGSTKPALSFPSFGGPTATTGGPSLFSATSTSSTNGLSFGSGASSAIGGGGGLFGNLVAKAAENSAKPSADNDEEGEYVPPKAEAVENEEPDAILTNKVSVFKYNGKEYQKLGVGMLYIKETDGKSSLLIRAATATGTVWLNSLCNAAMKATKADEKGEKYRITCPTSSTEMATMLIRFGSSDAATKFAEKLAQVSK